MLRIRPRFIIARSAAPRDNLKWPDDEVKGAVEPRKIKFAKFAGPAPESKLAYIYNVSPYFSSRSITTLFRALIMCSSLLPNL